MSGSNDVAVGSAVAGEGAHKPFSGRSNAFQHGVIDHGCRAVLRSVAVREWFSRNMFAARSGRERASYGE